MMTLISKWKTKFKRFNIICSIVKNRQVPEFFCLTTDNKTFIAGCYKKSREQSQ